MDKLEFKTSGAIYGTLLCLFLNALMVIFHFYIYKFTLITILSLYFTSVLISIIASFYIFRGLISLEIRDGFLHIKWVKKPYYTLIKETKIEINSILKASYLRSSRGPDTIKLILDSSSKPTNIKVSTGNSININVENDFFKKLNSKAHLKELLDKKLASSYLKKHIQRITVTKINTITFVLISLILGCFLGFFQETKTLQNLFLASLFVVLVSTILNETAKYTRKEFLTE